MRWAHASSSAAAAGRQTKIRRRLGVSSGTAPSYGAFDGQRLDLGVPVVLLVVRQDGALHHRLQGALGLPQVPHERDPDDVRSAVDRHADLQVGGRFADVPLPRGVARLGRRPGRGGRRAGRLAPDREAPDAPAVDAQVENVPSPHPADVVLPVARQPDAEDVVAVGGEMVGRREPAAGSERQVLVLPVRLRQQHRVLEACEIGRGRDARGQARDPPRGRQVALQLRGRDREHLGVVVEAGVRRLVPGQQRRHVDLQREEVANRVAVLRAVQAMHRAGSARIRVRRRRLVDARLQPARDRARLLFAGPRTPRGRHRARLQSRDNPLPHLRVGARPLRVRRVQGEPGGPDLRIEHGRGPGGRGDAALVVAADAVSIQEVADRLRRSRRRLGSRGGQEPTRERCRRSSFPPSPRRPRRLRSRPAGGPAGGVFIVALANLQSTGISGRGRPAGCCRCECSPRRPPSARWRSRRDAMPRSYREKRRDSRRFRSRRTRRTPGACGARRHDRTAGPVASARAAQRGARAPANRRRPGGGCSSRRPRPTTGACVNAVPRPRGAFDSHDDHRDADVGRQHGGADRKPRAISAETIRRLVA